MPVRALGLDHPLRMGLVGLQKLMLNAPIGPL